MGSDATETDRMTPRWMLGIAVFVTLALTPVACHAADGPKIAGALFSKQLLEKSGANAKQYPWAAEIQKQTAATAEPWMKLSDDELWALMFGNTIKRAWQVWSSGYCPLCKKSVPMYEWQAGAMTQPWKMRCPRCKELFPKNDFREFYLSGLDEHGIFDPKKADRSLLFNVDHPDPKDPLHMFAVDDGEGYVEGKNRWRFIGAYLIYGQWKQAVYGGIVALANAYTQTGDLAYAHKAGILLDRVADIYPSMNFGKEGVMYEGPPDAGYVSTWHDACDETRNMAMAYDQVFEALRNDRELQAFLSGKARQVKIANPKASFAEIQRNIEDRILRDPLANQSKIRSNYPQTDITVAIIKAVLGWPGNREEVMAILDDVLAKATAVDGLTGEKGLAAYSAWSPKTMAEILGLYARIDPGFLKNVLARHPKLPLGYRFYIDTWCFEGYYPNVGDTGGFARLSGSYAGVNLDKNPGLRPSGFSFLWKLYELTGDPAFVQVLYRANGSSLDGLPHDLFADDPAAFQKDVKAVIDREGRTPKVGSVDKQEWHLALLRSGEGKDERIAWLNYEAGRRHGHADALNLGLYAQGLDLMSDFGYPPIQFGGWTSPKAKWYAMTAAHNTVVVDGKDQVAGAGKTTLWGLGKRVKAIRVSAPKPAGASQYERTVALIDTTDRDSYIFDVFRVVGGTDHTKFTHAYYGKMTPSGLSLGPAKEYGRGSILRGFSADPAPKPGWSVDWTVEDRLKRLQAGSDVHLRYTDLTTGAQAVTAEAWVYDSAHGFAEELWIPCVATRRQAKVGPLASTFVSVIEPYSKRSSISRIRRLPLETLSGKPYPDANVAVEVTLADGRSDLIIAADVENPLALIPAFGRKDAMVQRDWGVRLTGEMCVIRRGKGGEIEWIALCQGASLEVGNVVIRTKQERDLVEISFQDGKPRIETGSPDDIAEMSGRLP